MNSDPNKAIRKFQKELNSGAVSFVLLSVLSEGRKAMYGYEIARLLESRTEDGALPMNQGALYPVLRSLEKQSLLTSEVQPSDSGPPRRYYRVTKLGRQVLKQWRTTWQTTTAFVNSFLGEQHAGSAIQSRGPGAKVSRGTGN